MMMDIVHHSAVVRLKIWGYRGWLSPIYSGVRCLDEMVELLDDLVELG